MNRQAPLVLVATAVISLVASACSVVSPGIVGSGHAVTESRTVENFTSLRVGTAIEATVIVGPDVTLTVTADDNLLTSVKTSVVAGRLTIEMQGANSSKAPVTVAITVPSLDGIEATSAAKVTATGINSTTLRASADSAGQVTARGNATSVDAAASSAGVVDLSDVPADTANVDVGSAARVTVNAQNSVTGSVDSGGSVHIEGNPPSVTVTADSGGSVVRD